ncbi:MAG: hypothetical protein R3C46_17090 [Hyphomonadaceae bacterium]
MTEASIAQRAIEITSTDLGGPGAPDAERCSAQAIAALKAEAGEGFRMTSLALDVASHPLGAEGVMLTTRTDKRARSIVFVSAEARSGDRLVFSAQGLFSAG